MRTFLSALVEDSKAGFVFYSPPDSLSSTTNWDRALSIATIFFYSLIYCRSCSYCLSLLGHFFWPYRHFWGLAPFKKLTTLLLRQRLKFTILIVAELDPCRESFLIFPSIRDMRCSVGCSKDLSCTKFPIGVAIISNRVPWGKVCCIIFEFIHLSGWPFVALQHWNSCI